MKNLIIYLIAIMISGSIVIENNPPKVVPYKVALETEDGVRFYVPANLVSVNQEQFEKWYNSPYRGKLNTIVEFKN